MPLSFRLPGHAHSLIAGVDEAGRGPLAGNVVAAAVILDPRHPVDMLNDSKKLTAARRCSLQSSIMDQALCYAVDRASVEEIDRLNILQASLLAMHRAVRALRQCPDFVYVDGAHCPAWPWPSEAVVQGDSRIRSVAAASILAKVSRDAEMERLEEYHPGYGFARHKGYPTREHLRALERLGPCPAHRRSFRPVADRIKAAS